MRRATLLLFPLLMFGTATFGLGTGEAGDVSYGNIGSVVVDAGTFAVQVRGTRGSTTSLEVRDPPDNYTVLHSVSRDRLQVWVERKFTLFNRGHRGQIVLEVPEDVELELMTSTGAVDVRDIAAERLSVETTTGRVQISQVAAAMTVETSTGAVTITDAAGSFSVTTTTGSIEVLGVTGDVRAESSTGRHRYEKVIGDVNARSTTGRIEIDGLQGTVSLRTSTGNQEGRRLVLTGDSSFESSTGNIEMDLAGDIEQYEFDLRSSTGSLRAGGEESQRRLFLGGTGFSIHGTSSTGAQDYY